MIDRTNITNYFMSLQDEICQTLETEDGAGRFKEDKWERAEGGGGRSRVIEGDVIEKGGVNFSAVHGLLPEKISNALQLKKAKFYATGVSIVLHPHSPMVPIIHMNVRYFETTDIEDSSKKKFWFGGGIDLTPHYIDREDARFFHQQLKNTCDQHHENYYPKFKKWADDYFYLKHRQETRGIGGIFFDRLSDNEGFTKKDRFDFVKAVGETFCPIYTHLMAKNKVLPFSKAQKEWQLLRRGRYVEFNLVWDKGTKFGLDTNGRTESILMSMPPFARWIYNFKTEENSPEQYTLDNLKKGIDWL